MILAEAKEDGCIWIPYEISEADNKRKLEDEEGKPGYSKSTKSIGITQKTMINIEDSAGGEEPETRTNYKKLLGDFVWMK